MNKRVWVFQFKKEVEQKGADKASWYVGWYDLAGKRHSESCGPGVRGRNQTEKRLRRLQGELDLGVHQPLSKKTWHEFRKKYEEQILLPNLSPSSQPMVKAALDNFERIVKPKRMEGITTQAIDQFIALRRQEKGKKPGSLVSPATVNKDLRHLKAALQVAKDWTYISEVPKVRLVKEPEQIPTYVTPEHFDTIYEKACPLARLPQNPGQHYSPADWWRSLVLTGYMTGLRIGELLSFKREDLDLNEGILITRAADNKGNRDEALRLNPVVVAHLKAIVSDDHAQVFRWCHDPRTLWQEFGRIQREAGVHLHCPDDHQHTEACHVYGFHDLRRAFATVNAPRMKPEALKKVMRHKSYKTTLGYVNLGQQVEDGVLGMPVPKSVRKARTRRRPGKKDTEA